MTIHGWNKVRKIVTPVVLSVLITLISGCATVPSGSPHPFTTMFDYDHEPAAPRLSMSDFEQIERSMKPEVATADTQSTAVR